MPFILKGIATAEDAMLALEHGVECIYVSNHGGRQLDHGRGAMEFLPEIVAAVEGARRSSWTAASAAAPTWSRRWRWAPTRSSIGRLYVYGLAAAGSAGIVRVLEILEEEIRICLGLLGVTSFAELDKSYVCAAHAGGHAPRAQRLPLLDLPGY